MTTCKSRTVTILQALFAALAIAALTASSAFASGAPIVKTKAATLIGGTEATLNAGVNPNGATTKYYFEYGTTTAYGSKTEEASLLGVTKEIAVSKGAQGLATSTTYHFRVVATNSSGTAFGADESFSTTTEKPEFAVKNGEKLNEVSYTAAFGPGGWQVEGDSFTCTSGTFTGTVASNKTASGKIVFTSCKKGESTCQSEGAKSGEIATQELLGTLRYISKAAKTVGLVFKPKSGESVVKLGSCIFAGHYDVRGAIIVPVEPVNVLKRGFSTGVLTEKEGAQQVSEYENAHGEKVKAILETTWPSELSYNPLGWSIGAMTVNTNKEVEIQA